MDPNAILDEPGASDLPALAPAATTTVTVSALPVLTQSSSALPVSSKSARPLASKSATALPSIQLKKLSADTSSITMSSDSLQQQESSMSIPGIDTEEVDYGEFLKLQLGSVGSLEAAGTTSSSGASLATARSRPETRATASTATGSQNLPLLNPNLFGSGLPAGYSAPGSGKSGSQSMTSIHTVASTASEIQQAGSEGEREGYSERQ